MGKAINHLQRCISKSATSKQVKGSGPSPLLGTGETLIGISEKKKKKDTDRYKRVQQVLEGAESGD